MKKKLIKCIRIWLVETLVVSKAEVLLRGRYQLITKSLWSFSALIIYNQPSIHCWISLYAVARCGVRYKRRITGLRWTCYFIYTLASYTSHPRQGIKCIPIRHNTRQSSEDIHSLHSSHMSFLNRLLKRVSLAIRDIILERRSPVRLEPIKGINSFLWAITVQLRTTQYVLLYCPLLKLRHHGPSATKLAYTVCFAEIYCSYYTGKL